MGINGAKNSHLSILRKFAENNSLFLRKTDEGGRSTNYELVP